MWSRIRQVFSAFTAEITVKDRIFLEQWLNQQERVLFKEMALPDQRHAFNTAYTALKLTRRSLLPIERGRLIKVCLLHDVGRVRGDMSTLDKCCAVLAVRVAPDWARRWAKAGRGGRLTNLRHAFYIYFHHAERSYQKLVAQGAVDMAEIVVRHHACPAPDDPPELILLRQADGLN